MSFRIPALIRPAEVDLLIGDNSKAKRVLGWQPKVSFSQLVRRMVDREPGPVTARRESQAWSETRRHFGIFKLADPS